MYGTIRVQPTNRSNLNISNTRSRVHEVIREPTTPLIHSEARIWLLHSGRGALNLQGARYELGPGDVVCILPWQITDVIQVAEPLQYTLLIYDLDSVNRLMKAFYESDLLERGWLHSLAPCRCSIAGRSREACAGNFRPAPGGTGPGIHPGRPRPSPLWQYPGDEQPGGAVASDWSASASSRESRPRTRRSLPGIRAGSSGICMCI